MVVDLIWQETMRTDDEFSIYIVSFKKVFVMFPLNVLKQLYGMNSEV